MRIVLAKSVWYTCRSVASCIHTKPVDVLAVARLLYGTAAHESGGFRYRRQMGLPWGSLRGGFGLWQVQTNSLQESIRRLSTKPELAHLAGAWLYGQDPPREWYSMTHDVSHAMQASDRLCCLYARLHYLWKPEPIPVELDEQAAYWKEHYNTASGAGTVEEYMKNWRTYAQPILDGLEV